MKKAGIIIGSILGIIILIIGGIGIWQKDNIKLLYTAKKYSTEQIQIGMEQAQEEINRVIGQYNIEPIRELTEEELDQLVAGEVTIEEIAERLVQTSVPVTHMTTVGEATLAGVGDTPDSLPEESNATVEVETGEKEIISLYTAKMYALQAKYTAQLGGLESQGWGLISVYKSGAQTAQELMPQGMALVNQALGLESQCDKEVESLLKTLTSELKKIEGDNSVVSAMRSAYQAQKAAKINYYMSLIPSF